LGLWGRNTRGKREKLKLDVVWTCDEVWAWWIINIAVGLLCRMITALSRVPTSKDEGGSCWMERLFFAWSIFYLIYSIIDQLI
jgi:hypothetical protein